MTRTGRRSRCASFAAAIASAFEATSRSCIEPEVSTHTTTGPRLQGVLP